jgi:hypothetical protein
MRCGSFPGGDFEKGLNPDVERESNRKDDGKFRFYHSQGKIIP